MRLISELRALFEPPSGFTHYGWFCGLVPVYIAHPYKGEPEIGVRWWCPHFLLSACLALFELVCMVLQLQEAELPLLVTGRIHRSAA